MNMHVGYVNVRDLYRLRGKNSGFKRRTEVPKERADRYVAALMKNEAHLLETAPPSKFLDALEPKAISLEEFLLVNAKSYSRSFNQTFYKDKFVKAVARTNGVSKDRALKLMLVVQPIMTHHYRQMNECEMHYRCLVQFSRNDSASFDMTAEDFEELWGDLEEGE